MDGSFRGRSFSVIFLANINSCIYLSFSIESLTNLAFSIAILTLSLKADRIFTSSSSNPYSSVDRTQSVPIFSPLEYSGTASIALAAGITAQFKDDTALSSYTESITKGFSLDLKSISNSEVLSKIFICSSLRFCTALTVVFPSLEYNSIQPASPFVDFKANLTTVSSSKFISIVSDTTLFNSLNELSSLIFLSIIYDVGILANTVTNILKKYIMLNPKTTITNETAPGANVSNDIPKMVSLK